MTLSRRAFGAALAAIVAMPTRLLASPPDLDAALTQRIPWAEIVIGENREKHYVWSRASAFCVDGAEHHSLVRIMDRTLASLTHEDVEDVVRDHRRLWATRAHPRQGNGCIPVSTI